MSLPSSLEYIDPRAFEGCADIKISFKGSVYGYEDINELLDILNNA